MSLGRGGGGEIYCSVMISIKQPTIGNEKLDVILKIWMFWFYCCGPWCDVRSASGVVYEIAGSRKVSRLITNFVGVSMQS